MLSILTNIFCQKKSVITSNKNQNLDSLDFSYLFPKPRNQGDSFTCLGWALVYGLMTYDLRNNSNLNNEKLSPYYNIKFINDGCKAVDPEEMKKSILKNGVAYFDSNQIFNECNLKTMSYKKSSMTFNSNYVAIQNPSVKNGFTSDELVKVFLSRGPFIIGSDQHAKICVGFNNKKKELSIINSTADTENGNYQKESYSSIRTFYWIMFLNNKETISTVEIVQKNNNFHPELNTNVGNPQVVSKSNRVWWLGRPDYLWMRGKRKYYYTEHFNSFCISVLKLGIFNSKAIIGIYDEKKEKLIYTEKMELGDKLEFQISENTYTFEYKDKSWICGWNLRPEINYTITKQ